MMRMTYRKWPRALLLASMYMMGVLGIVASGGGGGSSDDVATSLTYDGNINPAVISNTNAARLVGNILIGNTIVSSGSIAAFRFEGLQKAPFQNVGIAQIPARLTRNIRDAIRSSGSLVSKLAEMQLRVDIDGTEPCDNSNGSIHITGFIEDNGTGTLTLDYINCQEGGEVIDGVVTATVNAFDFSLLIPIDAIYSFSVITITSSVINVSVDGLIRSQISLSNQTEQLTTSKFVARDNSTGEMLLITNQVSVISYDNISSPWTYSETISGRIYDSTHGFVDFTTTIALNFSTIDQDFPDNGLLLLSGNQSSRIQVTALSATHAQLEIDIDGNSQFDSIALLEWLDLGAPQDLGDSDDDGLHNSWETGHGMDPNDANDANLDLDGDWLTNLVEYQEFSDPNDASSYPENADFYDLDSAFGSAGTVLYEDPVAQSNEEGRAVDIQSDGKILVTGFMFKVDRDNLLVLRYNSDGTLDNTFGTNGVVTYSECAGCASEGYAITQQSDGRIVVSGYTVSGPYDSGSILVLRLNYDGSLDGTFGSGGRVVTNIASYGDYGYDLAIQQDGKIVIGGSTSTGNDTYALVLRYNSDGTLDSTFSTGGMTTYDGIGWDKIKGIAIQTDGKIVATGSTSEAYPNVAFEDVLTLRYNNDGSLDPSFGINGVTTYNYIYEAASDIALQADGSILIAGNIWDYNCGNDSSLILKYSSKGTLDPNFGISGVVTHEPNIEGCLYASAQSLALRTDGKILTIGRLGSKLVAVRYLSNGVLDSTFSREGYGLYDAGGSANGFGLALQNDEKVVATGVSTFHDNISDSAVLTLRLHAH